MRVPMHSMQPPAVPRLTSSPSAANKVGRSHIPVAAEQKALHLAWTFSPSLHRCFFRERLAASPLLPSPFSAPARAQPHWRTGGSGGGAAGAAAGSQRHPACAPRRQRDPRGDRTAPAGLLGWAGPQGELSKAAQSSVADPCGAGGSGREARGWPPLTASHASSHRAPVRPSKPGCFTANHSQFSPPGEVPCFPPSDTSPRSLGP